MDYITENAILCEARRALDEFNARNKKLKIKQKEELKREVVNKHFNVVKALGISRVKFLKFISNVKNDC